MISPIRRHHQRRVNARLEPSIPTTVWGSGYSWGNKRGRGRFWKRKLSKSRRAYAKALIRGQRGSEPSYIESIVSWRAD